MAAGPFPTKNADFNSYVQTIVPYLTANAARLGISASNIAALAALLILWKPAFAAGENPDTATATVNATRDSYRHNLEALLRSIYHDIPESALTTQDRETLHLPAHNNPPTAHGVPTVAPVVSVDKIQHLQHILRFQNPDTPASHAKPDGVASIEVYGYVMGNNQPMPMPNPNPMPTEDNFHHIASTGKFLYTVNFGMQDVGKTICYIARYKSTRGDFGPISVMIQSVVA